MSLILCPECGTKISNKATACPHCGYQSNDSSVAISEQDNFEVIPVFKYDIEEWNPIRGELNFISSEENKSLFQYFGNWETIKTVFPSLAETIKLMSSREKILVADMDPYIKSLIDKGIYRFTIDKTGKILPTIRDSKKIIKQVRLKELTLPPDLTQLFFQLSTLAVMAQILDEFEYFKEALREIVIELQNDRVALAQSARDQFKQALKIEDTRLRENVLNDARNNATISKRALMKNFPQNMHYIREHYQKSRVRLALTFNDEKDLTMKSSIAFEDLVWITIAVQVECESYLMLGAYETSNDCLIEFKNFIFENKLNERDTLLMINECLDHKQNEVVDKFSDLASRVTSFDANRKIVSQAKDMIMFGKENEIEKVWKKPEEGTVDVHSCKNCGCELMSTNKYEHCRDCRKIIASNTRNEIIIKLAPTIVNYIFTKRKS